ncbi:TPA: hypothetical protein ACX6RS_002504 [Photobacterium damselae]|uniref:hypothetical protein n=1 Tax=Photobacterium damselae TaxID=38293 RepID=UPI0022307B37|nr:hypothetical protein [Photobacterium damselae]ELI6448132.1 hypothetical protein [Photobacterium damselae]ELV7517607.1 hypothetical protein [Photobacterium damselae]
MKYSLLGLGVALLFISSYAFGHDDDDVCLKDSLPGECCHEDPQSGVIHCH